MSGTFNGVKAHILEKYPLAFYIHCTSHSLNLAVSNACSVKSVRNTMGSIQEICVFFRTPKRQHVLEKTIDKVLPSTNKKRLKMMCPTRWVERHDAILVFIELYKAILVALDEISEWEDIHTSSKAKRLMIIIEQPEFIITTHIIGKVFSVSMPLSRQLQTENIDLLTALKVAGDVQKILQRFRGNVVNDFHIEFLKIEQWCQDLNIDTDFKKLTRTQKKLLDELVTSTNKTAEDFYRLKIYVPFLDNFLSQLHDRFIKHHKLLQSFSCILPGYKTHSGTDQDIKYLIDTYQEDLNNSSLVITGELYLWQEKCNEIHVSKSALDVFSECDHMIFPHIHKLLKNLITLPVTTATGERSFSTLKRLKTYIRNSIGQPRLNDLALMNIHRDIKINTDEVIDEMSTKSRRLNFRLE
ncbi:52 kDa repressor of the inhibitor of the protein kinase-like [Myzus persicae]|uniref:52 kDa repressor of the inhibitor of the protein kinase-like n=1 Tax=Myzus persicae TaxID=13164 RepID=UPI000B93587B|nr:52 kDa repressor of the inhibitor of the protein kinase-like [Myzus persicae]